MLGYDKKVIMSFDIMPLALNKHCVPLHLKRLQSL